jgi:hypothetical protein
MYARVLSAQVRPERLEEMIRALNETLLPAAAAQPGNRGFLGLADESTGQAMTITFWATPQDIEASESSGFLRRQLAQAAALLGGPVTRETFKVVAEHNPFTEERNAACFEPFQPVDTSTGSPQAAKEYPVS